MLGKIKYVGKSFGAVSLTNGKVYDCVAVEYPFFRVIDDSGEDYLYLIDNPCSLENPEEERGKWVIIDDPINELRKYLELAE